MNALPRSGRYPIALRQTLESAQALGRCWSYQLSHQGVKVAVSVMGPFIMIEAGLVVPVNDPGPLPIQLEKWKLGDACALITTLLPPFCHPLTGSTAPPAPAFIVRKYCLPNIA